MLLALLGFEILCMGHPSVGYGSEDLTSLSLQDSVRFALSHTPEVSSAQKTHRVSELQYTNSWAKLLPSLDLWTQNGFQNNLPDPDFLSAPSENPTGPWSSRLGLSLKQNLYDNGESLIQMSIADLNQELARVNQLKTRDSVILQVTQEFYGFSESSALLEVMHQQRLA